MKRVTFDSEGRIISEEELPPEDAIVFPGQDLASAITLIREQAALLTTTGPTAVALNATADALEALMVESFAAT